MRDKKIFELEQVLSELGQGEDSNPENLRIY